MNRACSILVACLCIGQVCLAVDPSEKPLGTPLGITISVTSNTTQSVFRKQLGTNMVVQGGFATNIWTSSDGDTHYYWQTNDLWSVDGSVSNVHCGTIHSDPWAMFYQNMRDIEPRPTLFPGDRCRLIFTVSGWATGTVTALVGGNIGTEATADGTYTNNVVWGGSDMYLGFYAKQATNNEFRIDNVSLVKMDSMFGRGLTIYNAGAQDVWVLPNVTTTEFDTAYANGETIKVKAGMVDTLPISSFKDGKYISLSYRCADGVTSTLEVTVD